MFINVFLKIVILMKQLKKYGTYSQARDKIVLRLRISCSIIKTKITDCKYILFNTSLRKNNYFYSPQCYLHYITRRCLVFSFLVSVVDPSAYYYVIWTYSWRL